MTERILMIEDDRRLAAMVSDYLLRSGFTVSAEHDAASGLATLRRSAFDALILDLMLPDLDGLEVCRLVRMESRIPHPDADCQGRCHGIASSGLELGADDYLPKPFEPRELLARLRAVLRRANSAGSGDALRFGRLEIDADARAVRIDGHRRSLTGYQFDLLLALARHAGRVMSRDQLMDALKGEELEAFDRSIDVHISRIRNAIEDDPRHPRRIITVRGVGYVFARLQDEASGP